MLYDNSWHEKKNISIDRIYFYCWRMYVHCMCTLISLLDSCYFIRQIIGNFNLIGIIVIIFLVWFECTFCIRNCLLSVIFTCTFMPHLNEQLRLKLANLFVFFFVICIFSKILLYIKIIILFPNYEKKISLKSLSL